MSQESINKVTTEFNHEEHRAKWLKRLADELDRIEPLVPIKLLPDGIEYPRWVHNVEREFSLVMLPSAKLKEPNFKITPKRMGALLGHMCEMAVWMMKWLEDSAEKEDQNLRSEAIEEEKLTKEELEEALEQLDKTMAFLSSLTGWYEAIRRLAKRALCSCVDQTYEDMSDFLLGYSDGFSRMPKTFQVGNIGNPTFEIYVFMLMFWRLIESMDSVRQLHELLVKIFGAKRTGDQKRVEKICQRMGLSFRKVGRPKKIIQTPA